MEGQPTSVEKAADELWVAEKFQSNSEIAGSPRNSFTHFSGRLTAPLVFAGALCKLYLKQKGITVGAHIQSIAQIQDTAFDDVAVSAEELDALRMQECPVINPRALTAMLAAIEDARNDCDSVGGVIECAAVGLPAGLGSPMMDTVESRLSSILFAVPAVKGLFFRLF